MNEVEFLRNQLSLERQHLEAVRNACDAAIAAGLEQTQLDEFCRACSRFLSVVGERVELQERAHCELLRARLTPDDLANRNLVDDLEAALTASRAAIGALAAALERRRADVSSATEFIAACRTSLHALDAGLSQRPPVIHHLFDRYYGVAEWRAAAHVDADTILEERELYDRVRAKLPRGIELDGADEAP